MSSSFLSNDLAQPGPAAGCVGEHKDLQQKCGNDPKTESLGESSIAEILVDQLTARKKDLSISVSK